MGEIIKLYENQNTNELETFCREFYKEIMKQPFEKTNCTNIDDYILNMIEKIIY